MGFEATTSGPEVWDPSDEPATWRYQEPPGASEMVSGQTKRLLTTCLKSRWPPLGGLRLACVVTLGASLERGMGFEPTTSCLEGRRSACRPGPPDLNSQVCLLEVAGSTV